MKKSDKIKRNFNVDYYFDWTYDVTIEKIRKDLDELEKLGVTSIEIEAEECYGSYSVSIKAIANRLETNEEYLERKKKEKEYSDRIKQMELKQLETLQNKYKTSNS